MTTFVLGVENVHAGAALCDYLADRVGPDDVVYAVYSVGDGTDGASARDGDDALNVVSVRLAAAAVRTRRFDRGNAPAEDLLRCADEADADEIVLGRGGDDPVADGVGDTVREVLVRSSRPVAVVPA